jgi:GNAT superfamily N-acetyltransferase
MATRTDHSLAGRLERAEAAGNAGFVEARRRLDPDSGACWIEVAGTCAMFDGVDSPITQTFGLGMFAPLAAADLEAIESFFRERRAATHHEVCPLSDPSHLQQLPKRGYRPIEQSNVLCQPLPAPGSGEPVSAIRVRLIGPAEADLWVETSVAGWASEPEFAGVIRGFGRTTVGSAAAACFVAELEGRPIATGSMVLHEGVALLAGASTVPEWRGRGAQAALLTARLEHAARHGSDLAMVVTAPGSQSQLNAERQGFRICYTRTKWVSAG